MTPLRAKYIQDLVIRGRSENTQEVYTRYVCDLARYYRRSPELISYDEVTESAKKLGVKPPCALAPAFVVGT